MRWGKLAEGCRWGVCGCMLGSGRQWHIVGMLAPCPRPCPPPHPLPTLQAELSAKQREAELNARKLSLESQIHWLTEENQRLGLLQQQAAGDGPAAAAPQPVAADVAERLTSLEGELRRTKRAEQKLQVGPRLPCPPVSCLKPTARGASCMCCCRRPCVRMHTAHWLACTHEVLCREPNCKLPWLRALPVVACLQAMVFRLRKDLEAPGGAAALTPAVFDNLHNVRSLEYDVDLLTQKCKVRMC